MDSLEHILRLGNLQVDERTKQRLMDQKNAWYLELIEGMRAQDILPGAKELVEELVEEGIGVGLGSSSRNAQLILDNVGLTPLFDVVVDGNHLTLSKPDPEVFLKGMPRVWMHLPQIAWCSKTRHLAWQLARPEGFLWWVWVSLRCLPVPTW